MNFLLPENLFIVKWQLFVHPLHLVIDVSIFKSLILSIESIVESEIPSYLSLAISAAPNAPIIPAISGLMASTPVIFSKLLKTASL